MNIFACSKNRETERTHNTETNITIIFCLLVHKYPEAIKSFDIEQINWFQVKILFPELNLNLTDALMSMWKQLPESQNLL